VLDAFTNSRRVVVPQDVLYDRGVMSHTVRFFDMDTKVADVLSVAGVLDRLRAIQKNEHRPTAMPFASDLERRVRRVVPSRSLKPAPLDQGGITRA
jgi:hypothetical protein